VSSADPEVQHEASRSSVQVVRNAKGDPQWTVKVRVGDTSDEVEEAGRIALAAHRALERELIEPPLGGRS
jgi:hypothetical protein